MTLELYPDAPELWLTKGAILIKKEQGEKAKSWLSKVVASEADSELKAKAQELLDTF